MKKINFSIPAEEIADFEMIPTLEIGNTFTTTTCEETFYNASIDADDVNACKQLLDALEQSLTDKDPFVIFMEEWSDPILLQLRALVEENDNTKE